MEGLGLNLGWVLLQIAMFGIVFMVLRAWVYRPLLNMLEKRRTAIAQGLEDARVASEARANAEREAGQIISQAQSDAAQVIRQATERAEQAAREIKANAEAQVVAEREQALADVAKERELILGELRGQVAALAISAAQKIIGAELDTRRQHALLEEFFSGIKSGRVMLLEGANLPAGDAEITSALPLTPDEKAAVQENILAHINNNTVSFRVDPGILGGLVVRVGDKVVDGSVSGQLEALRRNLH